MNLAHIRTMPHVGGWLAALTLMAFAALAGAFQAPASAQVTSDPDYWKGTPERRATVNRLVYSQSPQTIPAGYDPVREAEEILRQRYRSLPPTNPQARPLWSQTANLTRTVGLSPALRTLGTIGLAAGAFELGWKIGSGINAKFLTIDVPEPAPWNPSAPQQIVFRNSGSSIYTGLTMPYDGWLWQWWLPYPAQTWKAFWVTPMGNGTELGCPTAQNPTAIPEGFTELIGAPHPNCGAAGNGGGDGGVAHAGVLPEGGLGALTPVQDYTDQPFDKQSWPGTAPPQTTVEQSIETELDKPENELLRDWLNYVLGSPGATDPTGEGEDNPEIEFIEVYRHWRDHGHKFTPEYEDPHEYWEGAIDVIRRGQDPSDPSVTSCDRSDGAIIYWDFDQRAWVIVKDGKIVTYYPPDGGFDDYVAECSK